MRIRSLVLSLLLMVPQSYAAKRALTHRDFDAWRAINGQKISNDGRFLAYGYFPQEGDGDVVIRDLTTGKEWRENAGQLPPPAVPDPNSEAPPAPRAIAISFTHDSKRMVFVTFPKAKATGAGDLVIVDLANGTSSRVTGVSSFQVPEKGDGFVVFQKSAPPVKADVAAGATPGVGADGDEDQRGAAAGRGRAGAAGNSNREFGSEMVIRKLSDGVDRTFPDVLEYSLTKDGKTLAYSVASPKVETDGVFLVGMAGDAPRGIVTGKGKYQKLTWNDKQDKLAFLSNKDAGDAKSPIYKVYLEGTAVVGAGTAGMPKGFGISERGALAFSKDGARIFFGTAPPLLPEHKATFADDEVSFDLWNYRDDHIQPMQKVRAGADRYRSFRAEYVIGEKKFFQLANEEMTDLVPSETGKYALGVDDREYRAAVEYGEHYSDSYLVDTDTGKRTLLAKKHLGTITWSPDGKHALQFDGVNWFSINVPSGKSVNLTEKLPVKFWFEENDTPNVPRAYGIAGWTKDGKHVLLYDHYDVWQIAPDGTSAVNVTEGFGRKNSLELRYARLDAEERTIDPAKELLLRAENVKTRESGFYLSRLDGKGTPRKVTMSAKDFGMPMKAKDADVMVLSAQTFSDYPDLYVTDSSMKEMRKVTDGNAQKANYLWGTSEMVEFRNLDGVPLQGALYKPENFDPAKKYPVLVYIYERLSQGINHFVEPKPMDSINISYYVSNGYLVFTPDIVYATGYPGQSALKAVLGGLDALSARGYVDEKNIGIQGHSWGGYQIAYMITQTSRFKAVEAGAPVANMTSAYDGIRWGSGLPRQFQYEKTQSRIGGTLWEFPLRFIENSPIFQADRVTTPLLMVHNDADDAVPWYQGIEYFLALRRLGKEVYLFTYNGEPHHLRRRANQKDYAIRMAQYFDFELKGGPKPAWMEKGIPYLHTPEAVALSTDK